MHPIGGGDQVALALLTNAVDCNRIQAAFCDDRHNQTRNFIPLTNLSDGRREFLWRSVYVLRRDGRSTNCANENHHDRPIQDVYRVRQA